MATAILLLVLGMALDKVSRSGLSRGDVAIDAGVASSLAEGRGFWTPWERGSPFRLDENGESFGHAADQHPPLWPLVGAAFIRVTGATPAEALNWASFAAHLAILVMMVGLGRRLGMGLLALFPAFFYAISAVGSAYAFNGSLYTAQAALYLCAAWLMGRPVLGLWRSLLLGMTLGAAYLLNYQAAILLATFLATRVLLLRRMFWKSPRVMETAAVLAAAGVTAAPWLIRNVVVFGNPFYSVNPFYVLSKAGAELAHRVVEGRLVLEQASLPAGDLVMGLLGCAWINIPFLLLLLLALYPGCVAATLAAGGRGQRDETLENRLNLSSVLVILLLFHLTASLAWPALKVRYLVPAGPPLLLLAWAAVTGTSPARRGRLLAITVLTGLFSVVVWAKGSLHGEGLTVAFLIGFLPMSLVILISYSPWVSSRLPQMPAICLGMLLIAAHGTWPGGAYFNVPPCPDFFGENKDLKEEARAGELKRVAEALDERGIVRVIGDLRLWHASPGLEVVTPPLEIQGEPYVESLQLAAGPRSIRYAVLEKALLARQADARTVEELEWIFEGQEWVIVRLGGTPP